jgi:HD domain-containing protein
MTRRRRVVFVVVAGLVAGTVAHFVAPDGPAAALCSLATGLVLGELLVLRLEDGSSLPLSYAVLVVLASAFTFPEYAYAVLGAALISIVLRIADRPTAWQLTTFIERLAVAAATFGAYSAATNLVDHQEKVAPVLLSLAAAALAQVLVDVAIRKVLHRATSFSPRGRLAWLAIASSGMLMAIGYRGVGGEGRVGIWGPLLFSTPLLAAWYAFERLDSATRSYRQTIEALAMAPELGGLVPPGHAERVATLASAMGEHLGLSPADVRDLEMAALLHHLGEVTLDEPADTTRKPGQTEVAAVTSAMMREIRPLAAAGDIVAGESDDPKRRLAVQVLRIASEYDDLTARDHTPGDLALESLRSAPAYVYDERVVLALERVLQDRFTAAS